MKRRDVLHAAALAAALPALPARANASFPARQVRIVVPYTVGFGPDIVARTVGDFLEKRWRQNVLIDNKPGASGIVAFNEIRQVAPDGHTLFIGDTGSLAVNPLIHDTLPYDPARDIEPITRLFRATFVIQVGAGSRFRSVAELLAAARERPQAVSYGSNGNGHPSHVAVELMARAAGVQMLHVPFKDGGAMLTAVAQREVDFTCVSMNTATGLIKAGRLRPLAVAAHTRLKDYADIPTIQESGGPPVEMRPWAALVGVKGMPSEVINTVQTDVAAALGAHAVRERIEGAGFEITPSSPAELRALMAADTALYAPLVREGRVQRV